MNDRDRDIMQGLADQGRRLLVARQLPQGKLDWHHVEQVRDDFIAWRKRHGVTLREVSAALGEGCSIPVLSAFTRVGKGSYAGDAERVARALNDYMELHARRKQAAKPAGFVETGVARRALALIHTTIEHGTIGLIYGPAGVGKTMVLQAAAAMVPGSVLVRVRQSSRSPAAFGRRLRDALKIKNANTTYAIQEKLVEALRGSGRLLMIDEAHQLKPPALELVRDLHDECGVPIVLAGTQQIRDHTSDTAEFFGQFNRRIMVRYEIGEEVRIGARGPGGGAGGGAGGGGQSRPLFTIEEVRRVLESGRLRLTEDGARRLAELANVLGLGGLGLCRQIVLLAARLAGGEPIDATLIDRVVRRMHGITLAGDIRRRVQDQAMPLAG